MRKFFRMNPLRLTVSLADQRFDQTKSIGIFNVSLGLCRVLAQRQELQRITLLTNDSLPLKPDSERVVLQQCAGKNAGKLWRIWWDQFGAYRAARKAKNGWLLLPKGYASFLRRSPCKLATYIHDTMQEYYREHHPHSFPSFENFYFRNGLRAAISQSLVIFVSTEFVAAEIKRVAARYRVKPPPIVVVGIGFEFPLPAAPRPRTRIVFLASRWPHKRTELAIQYAARWQKQRQFAGSVDWVGQMPDGLALPAIANWRLHSRLDPDDYNRLLAEAHTLVYFSEYEGFGMPPVEAALAGACPVVSDMTVTREVMQDAGFRFANGDYEDFAMAMDHALNTPRQQIDEWAEQLLKRHNWQAVAEKMVRALESYSKTG
jgi:glycosyltransferase involved in cell wall biosynthesis